MVRFTATPCLGRGGLDISQVGLEGLSQRRLCVIYDSSASYQLAEDAARLLALSMSLPGGIEEALSLVRAQMIRSAEGA